MLDHYIIFRDDSTFEYFYQHDIFGDHLNGKYNVSGAKVKLTYLYNYNADGRYSTLHSNPPDSLFYENDKLYELRNGKVVRRSENYQISYTPKEDQRHLFRRKYVICGPFVAKRKPTFYMRREGSADNIRFVK
jgi:hypothetical protein